MESLNNVLNIPAHFSSVVVMAVIVVLTVLYYADGRAIGTTRRPDLLNPGNSWPILGHTLMFLKYRDEIFASKSQSVPEGN